MMKVVRRGPLKMPYYSGVRGKLLGKFKTHPICDIEINGLARKLQNITHIKGSDFHQLHPFSNRGLLFKS